MRRFFRWLGYCFLALLILLTAVMLVIRISSPWVAKQTHFFETLLSHRLGVPVHIQGMRIHWHGTKARILIDRFTIDAKDSATPVLDWEKLSVEMDAWHLLEKSGWVLDEFGWEKADAVLSFDKDNHLQLGYPTNPVRPWLTNDGRLTWNEIPLSPRSAVFLHDTNLQLIRSSSRQTTVQIADLTMTRGQEHRFNLRFKLAGQSHWQQASALWTHLKAKGPIQIDFPLDAWDVSPLLDVLSEKNEKFKSSLISWHSNWQKNKDGWSGGFVDFNLSFAWGDNKHLSIKNGTGVLSDHNPTWVLNMSWPTIQINDQKLPPQAVDLTIQKKVDETRCTLNLPSLDLAQWGSFIAAVIGSESSQRFRDLGLKGSILKPSLQIDFAKDIQATFRAVVDHVSWSPSVSAPGFSGLSGQLSYDLVKKAMDFDLAIKKGEFNWPAMFESKWEGIHTTGSLSLKKQTTGWQLSFRDIRYRDVEVSVNTSGALYFDPEFRQPYFDWSASFSVNQLEHVKNYLPYKMAPHTRLWLKNGFQKGVVKNASMSWRGPIEGFPYPNKEGEWHLFSPVSDLSLLYKPDWPWITKADGRFYMDNTSIHFSASTANLVGNTITDATGKIPDVMKPILWVQGKTTTHLQDVQHFMNVSPLPWKKDLQVVELSGPVEAQIQLEADVSKKGGDVLLNGAVNLEGATVNIPITNLKIDQVTGLLKFTEKGIVGNKLLIQVLNQKATADIETKRQSDGTTLLALDVIGKLSMQALEKQMPFELLRYFHGVTPFEAHLLYGDKQNPQNDKFSLQTSMQGVSVKLPAPFNKEAKAELPVHFEIALGNKKPIDCSLSYGSSVQALIRLQQQGSHSTVEKGSVVIGNEMPRLPESPGLGLSGTIDQIDAKAWLPVLKPFFDSNSGVSDEGKRYDVAWSSIKLGVKQLYWGSDNFSAVTLSASPNRQGWTIQFTTKYGSGSAFFPKNKQKNLVLDFKNVDWEPLFTKELKGRTKEKGKAIDWSLIPAIEVDCDNCRYGKISFGDVGVFFKPLKKNSYQAKANWAYKGLFLSSTLQWGDKQSSQLIGRLATNDLSRFVNSLSSKHYVEEGEGLVNINLRWPKYPFDFSLGSLSGGLRVKFENLRFINLPENVKTGLGIAKFINVLSIQNSLPFVNLIEKGFYIHRLTFTGNVKSGVISTKDFEIYSPVVNVQASGWLNFIGKKIHLKLSLQPQVTGSIPIIAAIAGGPLVGIIAYALNQIVEPLIGKAVALHYTVTGPLASPRVNKVSS
jgi:uncharacterized protein (TIGR02099 family)